MEYTWFLCHRTMLFLCNGYYYLNPELRWSSIAPDVVPSWLLGMYISSMFLVLEADYGQMLATLQSSWIAKQPSITQAFADSHCAFWTSIGLEALTTVDKPSWWSHQDAAMITLQISLSSFGALRAVFCLLVPRRPDVFYRGQIVAKEHTVTLWSRLTFAYVSSLVRFVREQQGTITVDSLPQLPFCARSENLLDALQEANHRGQSLFWSLWHAHIRALMLQLLLSVGSAVLSFGPQIALFGILKGLEGDSTASSGIWAAVLGVAMFLSSSVGSWLWWATYSRLAIPIYSELLALLYAKGMRRKILHLQSKEIEDAEETPDPILNLATVDTKRISDYVSYNHLIPSSVTQFIIGCLLLLRLIGWQSLLAGLAANLIASPLNSFIAKVFVGFQQELMQARDRRTAVIHEVVKNIRQIKFSSLESAWQYKVLEARDREITLGFRGILYETGFQAIWTLAPLMLSAVSLTVYALLYGDLEASVAFTAISIFGSLEVALTALPHLIRAGFEAYISIGRVDKYLQTPDRTVLQSSKGDGIIFQNATVAWPSNEGSEGEDFRLSELNFKLPPKSLTIITGRTGCGKSLLLSSILGECDVISGSVRVPSTDQEQWKEPPAGPGDWIIDSAIAYVAQSAWTENGTIRDNILFGLPLNPQRYQGVLYASGLEKDLGILTDGDQTDIGANGINLSGGQRLRVSFARALYSRAGILIMDDIFSALDAGTGQHVYEHGLTSNLAQNRTRILATHHVALCLPKTNYCVLLADGTVASAGTVQELKESEGFRDLLVDYDHRDETKDQDRSSLETWDHTFDSDTQQGQKFSPEELRATGAVPVRLYWTFVAGDISPWFWILGILSALLYTTFFFGRSWWLNIWTSSGRTSPSELLDYALATPQRPIWPAKELDVPEDLFMYIGVYVGLSFAASLAGTLRYYFIRSASLRSSQALFKNILSAVLAAPLRWVDTVPLGRVLNRFTSDIHTTDSLLGSDLADVLLWTLQIFGVVVASVSVSPLVLIPAAVLLGASMRLSIIYLTAVREVKRLESISRSPILEQFTSSLVGLTTIRAFDQSRKYINSMFDLIDGYAKASWHLWLLNWWLQLRINLLGALFSMTVAFLVVKFGVSASLAGFAISSLLQYSTAVSAMIRFYANFEMDMNATERIIDYANIDSEPQDGFEPPAAWPAKGSMVVENLTVSYSPTLPPVLKNLTFVINSNERVGVVGRTGAGKSTLALALFRFMEASSGEIRIDGLDTFKMKLHALRKALAIVPQQPTLFTGTMKSNLDPFNQHSEADLLDALERVHLISPTSSQSFTLSTPISPSGSNLSQGQRQLLCLARAILQRPKIMILDEATSSVDKATDESIQKAIRSEFGRDGMSSLLVIAHRLSTIADFDRILVLDEGEVVEFGTPKELMGIEGGIFRALVGRSGERGLLERVILGA